MRTIRGTRPPPDWRVKPAEVHVWTLALDVAPAGLRVLEGLLSPSELDRARRFRSGQVQNRFIAGRGLMRILLSRYRHASPAELEFTYGPCGKPYLSDGLTETGPSFNLAHSENLALLAVARGGMIGVDIERIRTVDDADEVVDRFFSARESAVFENLSPEQKSVAFFNLWTRKEAWLKATGEGIGNRLKEVEVSFKPGEPAQFIDLPPDSKIALPWFLHHLEPAPGFIGALAVGSHQVPLQCCCWDQSATRKMLEAMAFSNLYHQ
jgi:4'-phosphopantetheinyl transferase